MAEREPLPPIQFEALAEALLARADTLVPMWLPGGVHRGHEYACGSLSGGHGTSCSVNLTTGRWGDFATDEKGNDLISLYAAIHGMTMGKAAVEVAREEGLEDVAGVQPARSGTAPAQPKPARPAPPPKPVAEDAWKAMAVVPEHAPAVNFRHQFRAETDIEHVAEYRTEAGLHGYVVRFRTSDGGKDTIARTWCTSERDGASRWHWKQFAEPRPLYFPNKVTPLEVAYQSLQPNGEVHKPTVILVEGEKKADTLQAMLDANAPGVYLVAGWPGGCKAWSKAAWEWLKGSTVLAWPDCDSKRVPLTKAEKDSVTQQVLSQLEQIGGTITDNDRANAVETGLALLQRTKPFLPAYKQPGMAAMLGIGKLLRDTHGCTVSLLPIPEPGVVVDGWDCGDAITKDGWTFEQVLAFFGKAQPLPQESEPDSTEAKKTEGLGGTKGAEDAKPAAAKKAKVAEELPVDEQGFTSVGSYRIPGWLIGYYDKLNKRWMASRKMVISILENDPNLSHVLAYNELSNNVQARVAWPWPHSKAGNVTDAVDLLLGKYLTDTYGLPSIARAALQEAIQTVAHTRRFHPIREYLANLEWDGTSRINKWLMYVLGEKPETIPAAMQEYFGLVGRYWLLGMVNRVMEPGCKFDYCPVLEGAGGLRKSTMVEILAGAGFYSDTPFEVGRGKEAQEQVQGLWVYEIAEMTHFSKAEVGAIKAFISSKMDRYRAAYGATLSEFPRQCVLVGTTNENTYLRDRTGNRRFWPIPVRSRINTEWLAKYRDQLLAEAFVLYGQGESYTPTQDQERRLFVPMQESRLVETAVQGELLNVLTRDPLGHGIGAVVNNLADFVTVAQLSLALGVDAAKSSPALEAQIRGWLDHEGWERVKKQINGARAWGYVRPKDWPPIEEEAGMEPSEPVAVPPAAELDAPAPSVDGDDAPF